MKIRWSDLLAIIYILAIAAFLVFKMQLFIHLTKSHPFYMGFIKFALLATFGECLKMRLGSRKKWIPKRLFFKFILWGIFGIWITWIFTYAYAGFMSIVSAHLWFDANTFTHGILAKIIIAFSISLWVNVLSGFAPSMMFTHYWLDEVIVNKCFFWPWQLFGERDTEKWGKTTIKSLFNFWIPAHTITFLLAPEFRVLSAAILGVALGFILKWASER